MKDLQAMIAGLESKVDMLEAELGYIDQLLVQVGFSEGIRTLKMTIDEILTEEKEEATLRREII